MPTVREIDEVIRRAKLAQKRAYSPYSKVKIGAAILTSAGRIYEGCNIENASYGLSCCAERAAIFNAVADGHRDLVAIAVVGKSADFTKPCGACRQVMAEFNPKLKVMRRGLDGFSVDTTLEKLLPDRFNPPGLSKR
jgi:cytidine deaminase